MPAEMNVGGKSRTPLNWMKMEAQGELALVLCHGGRCRTTAHRPSMNPDYPRDPDAPTIIGRSRGLVARSEKLRWLERLAYARTLSRTRTSYEFGALGAIYCRAPAGVARQQQCASVRRGVVPCVCCPDENGESPEVPPAARPGVVVRGARGVVETPTLPCYPVRGE